MTHMRHRVFNLLLEFAENNTVEFKKSVVEKRFTFCTHKLCNTGCSVYVKCSSIGNTPTVSTAQMKKFKLLYPEDFI